MGFWSSVGSFISSCAKSVVSTVCSVAKCVTKGISSLAVGIGKVVVKGAANLLTTGAKFLANVALKGGFLGKIAAGAARIFGAAAGFLSGPLGVILGPIIGELVIRAVVAAVTFVAKKLGILNEKENPEEIGYRLEEAENHPDWKKRDDFNSTKEYYNYLREQIPDESIDTVKMRQHSLEYAVMGAEMLRTSIGEELNINFPIEFLLEIGRCRLDGAELMNILDKFIKEGYELDILRDYLRGKLKGITKKQVEEALTVAMAKSHPEWEPQAVADRIAGMKLASRQDEAVAWMYQDKIDEMKKVPEDQQRVPAISYDVATEK